ncbi:hypothetical protein PHMEG_0006578 [Phytophthora megakarya]|uniref:Reverse transcriptase n=1 Tax=Phytophthora megakarya TaxID=4795 RepID=A0A225WQN2_9STRA|nr:hypothetical protein PHMEG_0006578 [Phytophthora megakarya]
MTFTGFVQFYSILNFSTKYLWQISRTSLRQHSTSSRCQCDGLCVLEPTRKVYIRQRFAGHDTMEFSINIREMRSAALAALHWGPVWAASSDVKNRIHVKFHIGNMSAVSWTNHRTSRHPVAQMYNRLLSLAEFQYNISFSATHIPGKLNVVADAGSRPWVQRTPCSSRIAIHRSLKCLSSMLRKNAVTSSTIAKYRQYWRQWCAFAQQMTWSRWLSPANACHRLGYFCNSSMVTRLEFSGSRQPTQYNSAEIIRYSMHPQVQAKLLSSLLDDGFQTASKNTHVMLPHRQKGYPGG